MLECICKEAGFCPQFNKHMGEHLHKLCQTSQAYRTLFAEKAGHQNTCKWRGNVTEEKLYCQSCKKGKAKLKVFECHIHGLCTIGDAGIPNCQICKDRHCLRCDFNKEGVCKNCGFKIIVNDATTVTRDCGHEPSRTFPKMPIFFSGEGNPLFINDLYHGQSVFYIGGGPSLLKQQDELRRLEHERGYITFGVNQVGATLIRPDLWCCCDDPKSFHRVIWADPKIQKFVPVAKGHLRCREGRHPVRLHPNTIQFNLQSPARFNHKTFLSDDNVCWGQEKDREDSIGLKGGRQTMMAVLKLCYVLGFKNVFLLGCDFNMVFDPARSGDGITYAFDQWKHKGGCKTNNDGYRIMNQRFDALQPKFKEAGFNVYNCTPQSKLNAFDFMDLELAMKLAVDDFPKEISVKDYYV